MEIFRMTGYVGIMMFCLVIGTISSKPCEPSVKRYQDLDGKFNENITPILSSRTKSVGICSMQCRDTSKPVCMSLNFNTRSKQCLIYTTPLDTNITNYTDKLGSQNWHISYNCQKNEAVEPRGVTTEIIPPLTESDTTLSPKIITTSRPSSTTDSISTLGPATDCVPGWGLLYPVLIACAVILIIILIIIAACCIHKHCEKKRKQGYRPFQPGPSRSS